MNPIISTLMPVRNRERHLPVALDSLLAQTVQGWEAVIVDDGSTDATPEVLRRYAARDQRFRVFRHPAATIAENRNYALTKAKGRFIAVLDSDDVALPARFERQLAVMRKRPNLGGLGCGFAFIDADGAPMRVDKYKQRLVEPDELRRRQQEGWSCFMHSSMLFRRSALDAVGGYRARFKLAEDDDLFLRLLDCCDLANLPETLVQYRWHGANTTGSLDSLVHRAIALASAHLRLAGLPDAVAGYGGKMDYAFLRSLFDRLGNAALPVLLMWTGLLRHYGIGEAGMEEDAWKKILTQPFREDMATEIRRHRGSCAGFPDLENTDCGDDAGTVGGWLRGMRWNGEEIAISGKLLEQGSIP